MMNEKIKVIDVSNKTEKEVCEILGMKYVPWYRDSLFWSLVLVFIIPIIFLWS